jgi:hypothetical protein
VFQHKASYFLFGIGVAGLLFALIRTYYLVWKMKKEREARGDYRTIRKVDLPEDERKNQA